LRFPLFHRVKGRLQERVHALAVYREVESAYHGLQRVRSLADSLPLCPPNGMGPSQKLLRIGFSGLGLMPMTPVRILS
jgi:hypothetical protein